MLGGGSLSQEFLAWDGCDGEGLFYKDWSCSFSSGLVHSLLCTGGSAEAVEGRRWGSLVQKMRDDGMCGRHGRVSAMGPQA